MHNSAYNCAQNFYDKYLSNTKKLIVVDFGSYDHNGSLKPIFQNHHYLGLDIENGPNVDLVVHARKTPFFPDSVDVIVSSSCFEHDQLFWVTFLEMCRMLKPNGYIYINAPSKGKYHAYPIDCWRFKLDSWKALETWANINNYNIQLLESYIDENDPEWHDSVGIFKKL